MSGSTITHFEQDPERLAVLAECMENYDVGEPGAEWPNNMISRRAVVYGSGLVAREGDVVSHSVDADELERCRRLSREAAALMDGVNVDMGSESADPFQAFFIAANVDETVSTTIDESLIRAKFGNTIFPLATITVEPLEEQGTWWSELVACGYEGEELEQYLAPWRTMIDWFRQQYRAQASRVCPYRRYRVPVADPQTRLSSGHRGHPLRAAPACPGPYPERQPRRTLRVLGPDVAFCSFSIETRTFCRCRRMFFSVCLATMSCTILTKEFSHVITCARPSWTVHRPGCVWTRFLRRNRLRLTMIPRRSTRSSFLSRCIRG